MDWLLLIRGNYNTMTYVPEVESAEAAWAYARRRLTLQDLDEVIEVLAVPVKDMHKLENL